HHRAFRPIGADHHEALPPCSRFGIAKSLKSLVADAVKRNRSPRPITGNFLEISPQNRPPTSLWHLAPRNSTVIPVGYTIIQAVSCYSAKQAVEAQEQAMRTATSDNCNLLTGDNTRRIA